LRNPRRLTRHWITGPLLFCAAVVLLFEEWLWEGATRCLRDLQQLPAVAACARWIRHRTPYQSLALFTLPVLSVLPLKGVVIVAWLHGQYVLGMTVLLLEKLIFTAVFAVLYQLTAPSLTRIGWILRVQNQFLRVRAALHRWLERQALFRRARSVLKQLRARKGLRRRFTAAYRMQRRRSSRFCFGR
jgi:hypothetical protein